MKPIKIIMALIAVLIILPACGEEEWENLTYEQKYIETLLHQQKPKHDIGYELVDSMRYVILKTGIELSPEEARKGLHHGQFENPNNWGIIGGDYFAEYYVQNNRFRYPTDTIGIVRSINALRPELKLSEDQILTYKGYEVLGIEDVTVDKGPIMHWIGIVLYSESDVPEVSKYVTSLGCRVASVHKWEYIDDVYVSVALPLGKKAIPTRDEIMGAKLKLKDVYVQPYLGLFFTFY